MRKEAAVPIASALPMAELPARVVTTPPGVICRITLLTQSATKTFPALSTATPVGPRNEAEVPVPSTSPGPPMGPAKWVTVRGCARIAAGRRTRHNVPREATLSHPRYHMLELLLPAN